MSTDIGNINEMADTLPQKDSQQLWFPSAQDAWPVSFSTTDFDATIPNALSPTGYGQWPVSTIASTHGLNAFGPLGDSDAAVILPTTLGPQNERLESTSLPRVGLHNRTEVSTAAQSPASSSKSTRSSVADHITDLQNALDRDSLSSKQLIEAFFSAIHPHWPILHAPTFKIQDASHVLLGSMLMLAGWLQDQSDHMKLAPLVLDAVTATLIVCSDLFISSLDCG